MKKNLLICLLVCSILTACTQKESNQQTIQSANMSEHNVDKIANELTNKVRDLSGNPNSEWGGSVVENSNYIFYTTDTELVQLKKDDMEKSVMYQWEKDSDITISLYCTESELYYIQNMRELYSIRLEDGKKELICTVKMLEKEGYKLPEIFGMSVYSGHIYLELGGFIIVQCSMNGDIGEEIAQDARSSAFWGDAFFYRCRSSNEIYMVNLDSKKEDVVREKEYEDHVQYSDIIVIDDKLYYKYEGTIYLYDKSGKDEKILESVGIFVVGKGAIYYFSYEKDNEERLCRYDVETEKINTLMRLERLSAAEYIEEARVVCDMLVFQDSSARKKKQYKVLVLE